MSRTVPRTLRDFRDADLLTAVAETFADRDSVAELLDAIDFPRSRRPDFRNPTQFWQTVCRDIENGLIPGGFEAFLREASELFPNHPTFADWSDAGGRDRASRTVDSPQAPTSVTTARVDPPWKKRLGTTSLVLAAVLAALSILAAALDLPKKWKDFRTEVAPAARQSQVLTGRLLDAETGRPLVGVHVQLPEHDQESETDKMGVFRFELEVPAETMVRVVATIEGYENLDRLTSIGPDQDIWRLKESSTDSR